MRLALAVPFAIILSSCSMQPIPFQRTPADQMALDKALAGRVAGEPQSCLATYRADNMQKIDDHTILYRDGRTVYRNDMNGGCHGLSRLGSTMVVKVMGGSLCRGDIVNIVDLQTGMLGGSCTFGDFVPYKKTS